MQELKPRHFPRPPVHTLNHLFPPGQYAPLLQSDNPMLNLAYQADAGRATPWQADVSSTRDGKTFFWKID